MKKRIDFKDWKICVMSDPTADEMGLVNEKLKALKVSDTVKVQAFENLAHENRGSTIANITQKCILVLVSKQSSKAEMLNTLAHEVHHVIDILCSDCSEENAAALSGEIMMRLAELV